MKNSKLKKTAVAEDLPALERIKITNFDVWAFGSYRFGITAILFLI